MNDLDPNIKLKDVNLRQHFPSKKTYFLHFSICNYGYTIGHYIAYRCRIYNVWRNCDNLMIKLQTVRPIMESQNCQK